MSLSHFQRHRPCELGRICLLPCFHESFGWYVVLLSPQSWLPPLEGTNGMVQLGPCRGISGDLPVAVNPAARGTVGRSGRRCASPWHRTRIGCPKSWYNKCLRPRSSVPTPVA